MAASACLFLHAAITSFGPQQDELIWWPLLDHPEWSFVHAKIGPATIPLLEMPYLGNLKFYLYKLFSASALQNLAALRLLPGAFALAASAIVIAIAHRLGGQMAAALTGILLLTNPAYLLPRVCDWGPMALPSFFFALLLHLSLSSGTAFHAFAFGLICGLGLWDKLTFFAPMLVAIAVAIHHQRPTLRHAATFLGGLLLGSSPLILANCLHPWVSFSTQTEWDLANLPHKLKVLAESFDGSAVYGYLLSEAAPTNYLNRLLNGYSSVFLLFLFATVIFVRPRPKLPCLLLTASFLAWLAMASRTSLAYSVHHTGLLQLAPELALGLLLAPALQRQPKLSYPLFALLFLPLLRFQSSLDTQGPGPYWLRESKQLAETLSRYPNAQITALDWGIKVPVEYHSNGNLSIAESFQNPTPCTSAVCIYISRTPKAFTPTKILYNRQGHSVFYLKIE